MSCTENIRVKKPIATHIPPANSIIPTYHAKKIEGSIEIEEKNFLEKQTP